MTQERLVQPRRARWREIAVSLVVLAIGAVTAYGGIKANELSSRQDRIIGCVTGYSNALADTLDKRAAAQTQAQEALDRVMVTVSGAFDEASPAASKRVRAAIEAYVTLRAHTQETQASNPLPQPPRDVCQNLIG